MRFIIFSIEHWRHDNIKAKTNNWSLKYVFYRGCGISELIFFVIYLLHGCSYCSHTNDGVASTSGVVTATVTALWNCPLDTSLTVVTPHIIVSTAFSVEKKIPIHNIRVIILIIINCFTNHGSSDRQFLVCQRVDREIVVRYFFPRPFGILFSFFVNSFQF